MGQVSKGKKSFTFEDFIKPDDTDHDMEHAERDYVKQNREDQARINLMIDAQLLKTSDLRALTASNVNEAIDLFDALEDSQAKFQGKRKRHNGIYVPFDQRVLDTVKASLLAIKHILSAPIVSNELMVALQELAGVAERFALRLKSVPQGILPVTGAISAIIVALTAMANQIHALIDAIRLASGG